MGTGLTEDLALVFGYIESLQSCLFHNRLITGILREETSDCVLGD